MKTFDQIREGFVSAAQRKAVWASKADGGKGHPDNKKKSKKEDSDAVKAFLAKGGKIKKLPPAKAQGYHGKDDPGRGMHGMMDKPDTKAMGTRKKVKSMEATRVEEMQIYRVGHKSVGGNVHARDTDHAMEILRNKGVKGKISLTHRGAVKDRIRNSKTGKPMAYAANEAVDMGDKQKKESLWDNIRKRRAAGKPKLKPGDKNYPKTLKINDDVKYPHMMYDPKTGNEVTAKTPMDHNKYAKMGYTHEKPKMKENYIVKQYKNGKTTGVVKRFKGLKKATAHANKQGGDHRVHKEMMSTDKPNEGYKSYAQQKAVWASRADAKKGKK